MYCPRCGKPIAAGDVICSGCGLSLYETNPESIAGLGNPPESTELQLFAKRISELNIKLICFSLIAVVILIISFIAASKIANSAAQIMQIRTSGGQTVSEVYDRQMANIYIGYAMFIRVCGIFFSSVLVHLGLNSKK